MKGETRLTGLARVLGLLIALALLLSLLLPLAGAAAQDAEGTPTRDVLSEVPTTGARRPGPIVVSSARVRVPDADAEPRPEGFAPVEMQVESVGLDAPIELGGIVDGAMQDPTGPWVVAWYDGLGKVGEGNNVVMAGHVDYYNTGPNGTAGPAVFYDVPNLAPGDVIRLLGENGETIEYAVEWTEEFNVATELTPEVIQNDIVGNTGKESLTLITCGGEFDAATGEYLKRWVLRANQI
ncbi:MAG: class F sortase [Chloroflexia bacterium]|nr:class F sortase [Chloroflexia bacterium]